MKFRYFLLFIGLYVTLATTDHGTYTANYTCFYKKDGIWTSTCVLI